MMSVETLGLLALACVSSFSFLIGYVSGYVYCYNAIIKTMQKARKEASNDLNRQVQTRKD